MRRLQQIFTLLFAGLFGPAIIAAESDMVELSTPRLLGRDEAVQLQITTSLPRGARLTVKDENGEILGAVTPFGLRQASTTATIPIPRSALSNERVRLKLEVTEPRAAPRAPHDGEVEQLELRIEPE